MTDLVLRGATKALSELKDKIVQQDSQRDALNRAVSLWRRDGKGGSYIVQGKRGCGRKTMLHKILDQEVHSVEFVRVGVTSSDAHVLDCFNGDQTKPRVIVIEDADVLAARARQTLLFNTLNATRNHPSLVFLIVNRQDFLSCLEKRVRSRIASDRITFTPCTRVEEFREAFAIMTAIKSQPKELVEYRRFMKTVTDDEMVSSDLRYMMMLNGSYGGLKRLVTAFLVLLSMSPDTRGTWRESWKLALALVQPQSSPFVDIISGISQRSLLALICVARRLSFDTTATVSYEKLLVDYKSFTNKYDRRFATTDLLVFKELDGLVDRGLLAVENKNATDLAYKRVTLGMTMETVKEALGERVVPSTMTDFLKMPLHN